VHRVHAHAVAKYLHYEVRDAAMPAEA
jgi:hypothetical protein